MIKQNWDIAEKEKNRIILLHETATKNQYIISEQSSENPQLQLPVNFNFNMGYWSGDAKDPKTGRNIKQQIDSNLSKISNFLKSNKNSNIIVTIETGESAIPNVDNESETPKKVETGYLSGKRAETIKKELENFFSTLVSNKLLKKMPTFSEPVFVKGTATTPGSQATKEQFAKATIKVDTYCLTGLVIGIGYFRDEIMKSGRKCHTCNRAKFQVLINDVPIKCLKRDPESTKVESDEYIANLNNVPPDYENLARAESIKGKDPDCIGGDRWATFVLSEDDAKKINSTGENLKLEIKCVGSKTCHSDVPKVWISKQKYDKSGWDNYFTGYPNVSGSQMNDGDKKLLLVLDKCGDPIQPTAK